MSEQTPSQKTDYEHARDALDWAFKISCQDLLGFVEGYRFDLSKNPQARKVWLRVKEAYRVLLGMDIEEKMYALPSHLLTLSFTYTLTDLEKEAVERWLAEKHHTKEGVLDIFVPDGRRTDGISPMEVRVTWMGKE